MRINKDSLRARVNNIFNQLGTSQNIVKLIQNFLL